MNKYTKRIISYLSQMPAIPVVPHAISQFPLIQLIHKCVGEYLRKSYNHAISEPITMTPLNTSDKPLMFQMLSSMYPRNFSTYQEFIDYYFNHQREFDMPDIIKAYRKFPNQDPNIAIALDKLSDNAYKQLYDQLMYSGSFVSLDNQMHAETSTLQYVMTYNDHVEFHIYYHEILPININTLYAIFDIVKCIAQQSRKTVISFDTRPRVTLFMGKQKKYINPTESVIGPLNINSGVTNIAHHTVGVWREEEATKVLIHELIHLFHLDRINDHNSFEQLENVISNNFCMHEMATDSPNESYTELLAVLIHSMIISEQFSTPYHAIITHEIKFSLLQISKLMKHYNITRSGDLINPTECLVRMNLQTSVISYFIIKLLLLVNITTTLEFIGSNPYLNNKADKFADLIETLLQRDYHIIDTYLAAFNSLPADSDVFVARTGRMTVFG